MVNASHYTVSKSSAERRMELEAKRILARYQIRRSMPIWERAVAWAEDVARGTGFQIGKMRFKPDWPKGEELARYYLMLVIADFMQHNFGYELRTGESRFLRRLKKSCATEIKALGFMSQQEIQTQEPRRCPDVSRLLTEGEYLATGPWGERDAWVDVWRYRRRYWVIQHDTWTVRGASNREVDKACREK